MTVADRTEVSRPAADGPELLAIWQEHPAARWMVRTSSEDDPDDPQSGWTNVDGDAESGVVSVDGREYTVAEARLLAEALRRAAEHTEQYGDRSADLLHSLMAGLPEIDGLPIGVQAVVRQAIRDRAAWYRARQWRPATSAEVSP